MTSRLRPRHTKSSVELSTGYDDVPAFAFRISDFNLMLTCPLQSFPITPLPTEHDAMAKQSALINRAIAMHLLREGQFNVARVFMDEVKDMASSSGAAAGGGGGGGANNSRDMDQPMTNTDRIANRRDVSNIAPTESQYLQERFQQMYSILQEIKAHNLAPAIKWAGTNSAELETRGSNLEFELCKLQFIWLTKPRDRNTTPHEDDYDDDESADDEEAPGNDYHGNHYLGTAAGLPAPVTASNLSAAFAYARTNFHRFSDRHVAEIQRMAAALVFASNIGESPYATAFDTSSAFEDVAAVFTREFCSMLGLSAESPLYVAATAGIIALPRLIKFIGATRSKRTEWTTADEMAFETPLPGSMMYHPIFVCPVSKEQTTEANPPMRLPCGHVLANNSLRKMVKGTRFKCPYCPAEGQYKDAQQIYL